MKKELIQHIAQKLHGFGFDVYISKDGTYGFYTNGQRVISFGGSYNFFVDFSGNYKSRGNSGTGWMIEKEKSDITEDQAKRYIEANAPRWANADPIYTTPEEHLRTYGKSSGYQKFERVNNETL